MNDDIEYMIELLGKPETVSGISDFDPASLAGKASENYMFLLREYGRSNWGDGRLQLVAPPDLQPVVDLVLAEDQDLGSEGAAFVHAYTPFGTLHFWHSRFGLGSIDLVRGFVFCPDLTNPGDEPPVTPLAAMDVPFYSPAKDIDFFDESGKPMFAKAWRRLGRIGFLECYGFVPALALGGVLQLENLRKLPAREHFAILAQATDFNLMSAPSPFEIVKVREID